MDDHQGGSSRQVQALVLASLQETSREERQKPYRYWIAEITDCTWENSRKALKPYTRAKDQLNHCQQELFHVKVKEIWSIAYASSSRRIWSEENEFPKVWLVFRHSFVRNALLICYSYFGEHIWFASGPILTIIGQRRRSSSNRSQNPSNASGPWEAQSGTNLVLGALYCGVFCNQPHSIAETCKTILAENEWDGYSRRLSSLFQITLAVWISSP